MNNGIIETFGFDHWLEVDTVIPGRVWAVLDNLLYRSDDDGATWVRKMQGIERCPGHTSHGINGVTIDPGNSNHLLAGAELSSCANHYALWETWDAGESWSAVDPVGLNNDYWRVRYGSHANRVYGKVAYHGFVRSDDGGKSWVKYGNPDYDGNWSGYVEEHPLIADRVFKGDGATSRSHPNTPRFLLSEDGGKTWRDAVEEYSSRDMVFEEDGNLGYAVGVTSNNLNEVQGGLFRTLDGGLNWNKIGDEGSSAVALLGNGTILISDFGEVKRSTDGGNTFESYNAGLPIDYATNGLTLDKDDDKVYLIQVGGSFYRSRNRGESWKYAGTAPGQNGFLIYEISRKGGQIIWGSDREKLWKSTDGGATFMPVSTFPGTNPRSMVGRSEHPNELLVTASGGIVYRTQDGGATWTASASLESNFSAQRIFYSTRLPERVYLIDFHHLWVSDDLGATWQARSYPNRILSIAEANERLYGAGFSSALWQSDDDGFSWQTVPSFTNPSPSSSVFVKTNGEHLFAFPAGRYWMRSNLNASTWEIMPTEDHYGPRIEFWDAPDMFDRLLPSRVLSFVWIYEPLYKNHPPVAYAGWDQEVSSETCPVLVNLDGTSSIDPDGKLTSYSWTNTTTSAKYKGVTPQINLDSGIHEINLEVKGQGGGSDQDTVIIEVNCGGAG